MGQVHDFLEAQGKQHTLALDWPREVVEAAASYMADDDPQVGFIFAGWTQAALPHKRLEDDAIWQVRSGAVTLIVEPGRKPGPDIQSPLVHVGVPFGSRARLIMLYLQTEALRTGSREVALGKSLRSWIARMGIPQGGTSLRQVRDQAERISRCRLTFHAAAGSERAGLVNQNIMDTAMFVDSEDARGSQFLESAKLSELFFEELRRHPVPVEEAAIRSIANNSVALDLYCWLAYRLHVLTAPKLVTWKALKAQFGQGCATDKAFRRHFGLHLQLALAVYRDARVEVDQRGFTLHPSRPPVAARRSLAVAPARRFPT